MAKPISVARLEYGTPLSAEQLLQIPIFEGLNKDTLEKYPGAVVSRVFKEGEIICREGEFGSTAFYIMNGSVDIFISSPLAHVENREGSGRIARWFRQFASRLMKTPEPVAGTTSRRFIPIDAPVDLDQGHPIAQLGPGDLFGEMTCMNFYPRSATVRARENVEVLEILRNILILLQKRSKVLKQKLDVAYKDRAMTNHLMGVPAFQSVSEDFIRGIRDKAELLHFEPDDVIVKQGDPADALYLVRLGFVKVTQSHPGGEIVLRYLHRGDTFGGIGILAGGVRTATCTAMDNVEAVKIRKDDIDAMMKQFPAVRETLEKERAQAAAESRALAGTTPDATLDDFLEQGLMQAKNLLLIDLERCTRCDDCVRACADSHDGVTRLIRDGLRYDKYLVATSCRSCANPLCMVGCPVGSIRRKESLEIVIEDWCIGCGLCAKQCPYGNINMHSIPTEKEDPADPGHTIAAVETKATTCDLCSDLGEPSCVYACPHDAAMRIEPRVFFADKLRSPVEEPGK